MHKGSANRRHGIVFSFYRKEIPRCNQTNCQKDSPNQNEQHVHLFEWRQQTGSSYTIAVKILSILLRMEQVSPEYSVASQSPSPKQKRLQTYDCR